MKRALPLLIALIALALIGHAAQSQQPMRHTFRTPMTARELVDALLSRDCSRLDTARFDLANADETICADLATEIIACGVYEARTVLDGIVPSGNARLMPAAIMVMDSDVEDVRLAALDVLLDAPFEWLGKQGDAALTAPRRERLLELLASRVELGRRAEGMATAKREPWDVHVNVQMGMLADRYFGAPGYLKVLRGLSDVMLGEPAPAVEAAAAAKPEKGAPRDPARERAVQEFRRRAGAAVLFRDIWIEDLTLFNYLPDAGYESRKSAVGRIRARLDEMERQSLTVGDKTFTGMRCGDYLLQLLESDNNEVKAAAYLRLASASGTAIKGIDVIPGLAGQGYAEAVTTLMALSRRDFASLRRALKDWWTTYRKATEPK